MKRKSAEELLRGAVTTRLGERSEEIAAALVNKAMDGDVAAMKLLREFSIEDKSKTRDHTVTLKVVSPKADGV